MYSSQYNWEDLSDHSKRKISFNLFYFISLKHIDLHSQEIYDDKKNSKKSLHILEDGTSGVQVGDIEQMIV